MKNVSFERTLLSAVTATVLAIIFAANAAAQSARVQIISEEIEQKKAEIERYDPQTSERFVTRGFKDWVLLSISPKARAEYYARDKFDATQQRELDPVLDSLRETVRRKLSGYRPEPAKFAIRDPVEERMMMGQLRTSTTRKILRIGMAEANWTIYKDSYGLPSYRFKRGYIWARDTADDHPFCKLYYITIVQQYAGGGRYSASSANYEETVLTGCPA